jgi:transposase
LTEIRTVELDDKTITWKERRLVVRSFKHAKAQETALRTRLAKAKAEIVNLTVRCRGKKRLTTLTELQTATDDILKRYQVGGLLEIQSSETLVKRHIRPYRDRPARTERECQLSVDAQIKETALQETLHRLGWRIYATNAWSERLSFINAVLAYREQDIAERGFGRLKGQHLSLTPMYLQRDDHATGLIRLLIIGLRVLTLLEFVVRRNLSKDSLAGLYAGNHKRETKRPTAETILAAFKNLDLIIIHQTQDTFFYLTPLSE